jgi:hypothetical protein
VAERQAGRGGICPETAIFVAHGQIARQELLWPVWAMAVAGMLVLIMLAFNTVA